MSEKLSERSVKIISCVSLFLIGVVLLLIGIWVCPISALGIVPLILGLLGIIFGIIPMLAFWMNWQDLSGE